MILETVAVPEVGIEGRGEAQEAGPWGEVVSCINNPGSG